MSSTVGLVSTPVPESDPDPNPTPVECDMCNACGASLGARAYFILCSDGNPIAANDYPTTGGPWLPAFTAAGALVWINGGGL